MNKFSINSEKRIKTVDPRLEELFREVLKETDISIIWGHRGDKEQQECYDKGHSKCKPGESKHNTTPALAIDVITYKWGYKLSQHEWRNFANNVFKIKQKMKNHTNWELIWGGNWKTLYDAAHWEIKEL